MKWICFSYTAPLYEWAYELTQLACITTTVRLSGNTWAVLLQVGAAVALLEALVSPMGLGAGKGFLDPGVSACFPSLTSLHLHSTINPVQRWASRLYLHCVFPEWNTPRFIVKMGWRETAMNFTRYSLKKKQKKNQKNSVGVTSAITMLLAVLFPYGLSKLAVCLGPPSWLLPLMHLSLGRCFSVVPWAAMSCFFLNLKFFFLNPGEGKADGRN